MSSRAETRALPLTPPALRVAALAYLGAAGGAEALLALSGPVAASIVDAAILLALAVHAQVLERRGDAAAAGTLAVLMLVPLLRLLSLTMQVRGASELAWYALVGAPLLAAVVLAGRVLPTGWAAEALSLRPTPVQAAIALTGIPLGLVAYLAVRPAALAGAGDPKRILAGCIVLLVFVGFTEELLFRGLLQHVLQELFGRAGILVAAAAYAVSYAGSLSARYVLFAAASGLFFGWCVSRTRALLGVCIAHGLLAIGVVLVWPVVFR
jgi:membrane protease YdiL (CAAX protease family)